MRALTIVSAILGAFLVVSGAVGAHVVPEAANERWSTALTYGFVHVLGALLAVQSPGSGKLKAVSGWLMVTGVALFSGVQIARMLAAGGSQETTLFDSATPLVPVGGVSMIAGWLILAAAAARGRD